MGIDFSVNLNIPMEMPFRGADICLILGNLLENAVEAAQKAEGKLYVSCLYLKQPLICFRLFSYFQKIGKNAAI